MRNEPLLLPADIAPAVGLYDFRALVICRLGDVTRCFPALTIAVVSFRRQRNCKKHRYARVFDVFDCFLIFTQR
jgi:hypothetical protein